MESPEEWGPHLLQRGDGGGERIGDSSNMIVPLPSRMRRRARGRCSGGNIDGRSDHDRPAADRPHHPVGGRPVGLPKVLRGGLAPLGFGLEFEHDGLLAFGSRESGRLILYAGERPVVGVHVAFSAPSRDRKSTRLNSSHANISYAVFCLKKKK